MKSDDKRCLCNKCADDYRSAGFDLQRTHKEDKGACERCNWHASREYIIKAK